MRVKEILLGLVLIITTSVASAQNPYGDVYTYDVYFNDKLLPGTEVAKPILKIGEPFSVKISLTVNQKSDVYVSLSCMEKSSFEIIDGPTLRTGDYTKPNILEANSTIEYEWLAKPTEKWAGGSLPLDMYYAIYDHGSPEPLVESGFTVAYPYISTEYYEGKTPSQESSSSEPETSSESTPAFTTLGTFLALALAISRR
ncbi:sarcinarray family MAST domain-containing protein [Methanosarcina sp. Mfa9]|uniref:sarcinarray family MAST domain-containing protein n=1 Tax=Methanosarcina sp. Mfa9 TaxID=3439063 RepID=UPI003F861D9C